MTRNDIRRIFTEKVTELLNQGYDFFPDTMSGHQGEIAKIDLRKGSQIVRVLLERELLWSHIGEGFHGDAVTLTVGTAPADTRVSHWDGTIWNNRLDVSFQMRWAELRADGEGWYCDMDEAKRVGHIQRERRRNVRMTSRTELGDSFKSAALKWLKKQPRMKTCKLSDIEKMERVQCESGRRYYEIRAKGQRFTIG